MGNDNSKNSNLNISVYINDYDINDIDKYEKLKLKEYKNEKKMEFIYFEVPKKYQKKKGLSIWVFNEVGKNVHHNKYRVNISNIYHNSCIRKLGIDSEYENSAKEYIYNSKKMYELSCRDTSGEIIVRYKRVFNIRINNFSATSLKYAHSGHSFKKNNFKIKQILFKRDSN